MRRFGLLGFPLTHSFSQGYFTEKFRRENITDAAYENFSLESIELLSDVLKSYPDLNGLNVTIPYKKQVLPFLADATETVKEMGACNCIKITAGKLYGYNTDTTGFRSSLVPFLKPWHKRALILGTGGASAAVAFVLRQLGIGYLFVSRRPYEDAISYEMVDEAILASHQLIINTTPLGMYPNIDACPPLPYHQLTPLHHLYDLTYNPPETLFLKQGREAGATIQNGREMLVMQAEESWEIWNS